MKKLTLANSLTCLRLLGGIALFFLEPLSTPFYIIYSTCGLTDGLDGPIARHNGTTSEFGAKLDSAADITFYTATLVRLFPTLYETLPKWIWWWVGGNLVLRLTAYIVALVKFHRFAALHTWPSKATGLTIFVLPYLLNPYLIKTLVPLIWCILILSVATIAGTEELTIHLRSEEYKKSIKDK